MMRNDMGLQKLLRNRRDNSTPQLLAKVLINDAYSSKAPPYLRINFSMCNMSAFTRQNKYYFMYTFFFYTQSDEVNK